jgi:Tfp pilus assembly protein PilF
MHPNSLTDFNADAHFERGVTYLKLGNYRQAISDFERAIEINPDYAVAYHDRSVVYGILGDRRHEIKDLQKAQSLGSKNVNK